MASTIKADTLQSTTSNVFVLNSAGTEYARFNSSGNLGLGTTSPTVKLDVVGSINVPVDSSYVLGAGADRYIRYRSTDNDILYSCAPGIFYQQSIASSYHAWFTGNIERLRIDSSGNVKLVTAGTKVLNSSGNPILQQTGSILQVVSTTKTDTFSMAGYAGYTDITGLTVTITPTSSTSKILINYVVSTGPSDVVSLQLFRNSTAICLGDSGGGDRFQATAGGVAVVNGDKVFPVAGNFLDSPATTSAITYKFQMRNWAGTSYVNRTPNDTSAAYTARSTSTITVMEIAG
jgi:hypothetical protein